MANNPRLAEVRVATQFKPGQSGNPSGPKPGYKHISTYIQKLMEDPNFEANVLDSKVGLKPYKGAPVNAIIQVTIHKAVQGDDKAREWLAKYGWAQKVQLGNDPENPLTSTLDNMSEEQLIERLNQLKGTS